MKHNDDDPVIFGYDSSRNISFHGHEEAGYTWGEWRELSSQEKADAMEQVLWELVDLYVEDDEDE